MFHDCTMPIGNWCRRCQGTCQTLGTPKGMKSRSRKAGPKSVSWDMLGLQIWPTLISMWSSTLITTSWSDWSQDTLEGFTPLHWAVLSDNPKAVIWSVHISTMGIVSTSSTTCLWWYYGLFVALGILYHISVFLITYFWSPDLEGPNLSFQFPVQRPQAVIWLLNHNADREIKDIQGRTAEDLIEETRKEFVRLVRIWMILGLSQCRGFTIGYTRKWQARALIFWWCVSICGTIGFLGGWISSYRSAVWRESMVPGLRPAVWVKVPVRSSWNKIQWSCVAISCLIQDHLQALRANSCPWTILWISNHYSKVWSPSSSPTTTKPCGRKENWGDFHQRYWGHAPKKDGLPDCEKAHHTESSGWFDTK